MIIEFHSRLIVRHFDKRSAIEAYNRLKSENQNLHIEYLSDSIDFMEDSSVAMKQPHAAPLESYETITPPPFFAPSAEPFAPASTTPPPRKHSPFSPLVQQSSPFSGYGMQGNEAVAAGRFFGAAKSYQPYPEMNAFSFYSYFPYSRSLSSRTAQEPYCPKTFSSYGHHKRAEEIESKYKISLADILSGKDTRTTLMIKNIPNKYTQPMLLHKIDFAHSMQYNLFYLPIDLKVPLSLFLEQLQRWLRLHKLREPALRFAVLRGLQREEVGEVQLGEDLPDNVRAHSGADSLPGALLQFGRRCPPGTLQPRVGRSPHSKRPPGLRCRRG